MGLHFWVTSLRLHCLFSVLMPLFFLWMCPLPAFSITVSLDSFIPIYSIQSIFVFPFASSLLWMGKLSKLKLLRATLELASWFLVKILRMRDIVLCVFLWQQIQIFKHYLLLDSWCFKKWKLLNNDNLWVCLWGVIN